MKEASVWGQELVLHCSSIWICPFFESIRWYFSLIRLLVTTSARLTTMYPRDSWFQKSKRQAVTVTWRYMNSTIRVLFFRKNTGIRELPKQAIRFLFVSWEINQNVQEPYMMIHILKHIVIQKKGKSYWYYIYMCSSWS